MLPSALPLIFTGLRLSLGVGWMVLIAAEMLAQNPGLGKFVWDEFQNGSSASLARIMVAVLTIGIIGFLLDRIMFAIQSAVQLPASAVTGHGDPGAQERLARPTAAPPVLNGHHPRGRARASSSPSSASPAPARPR